MRGVKLSRTASYGFLMGVAIGSLVAAVDVLGEWCEMARCKGDTRRMLEIKRAQKAAKCRESGANR